MATDKYHQVRRDVEKANEVVDSMLTVTKDINRAIDIFETDTHDPILEHALHGDENIEIEIAKLLTLKKQEFEEAPDMDDNKESTKWRDHVNASRDNKELTK